VDCGGGASSGASLDAALDAALDSAAPAARVAASGDTAVICCGAAAKLSLPKLSVAVSLLTPAVAAASPAEAGPGGSVAAVALRDVGRCPAPNTPTAAPAIAGPAACTAAPSAAPAAEAESGGVADTSDAAACAMGSGAGR